jgi:hypothetical protein
LRTKVCDLLLRVVAIGDDCELPVLDDPLVLRFGQRIDRFGRILYREVLRFGFLSLVLSLEQVLVKTGKALDDDRLLTVGLQYADILLQLGELEFIGSDFRL